MRAASFRSSTVFISRWVSTAASRLLGVTTVASGTSTDRMASTASSRSSRKPVLATITGSMTVGPREWLWMRSATHRMISLLDSIPVLTASAPMSATMASIWASIISVGVSSTELTPRVFCAVMVVMAQVPNTPMAPKVLRSAWMPAPPPESEPAIVIALGTRLVVIYCRPVSS